MNRKDKKEKESKEFLDWLKQAAKEIMPLQTLASGYVGDNFSKKETITAKKNDLKKFLAFLKEREIELLEDLGKTSPAKLDELCRQFLIERGEQRDSIRTLRRRISTIKNFLGYLTETQTCILPVVPSLNYKDLKQSDIRSSASTITAEEWEKLKEQLKQAKNPQVRPLACLAVMGGGRTFAECRNMIWRDIEFDFNRIVIRKAQYRNYLELVPELKKILRAFKGGKESGERIFKICPQVMNKTLKVHARQAGIDDSISFMSFRASFIRWAGERDYSLNEVLKATMHKSGQTMRSYYEYSRQVIPLSPILKTEI